jgi:tRNA (guanine37-N1)-methyltransferase
LRIWIISLFPEFFGPLKECGVLGAAIRGDRGISIDLNLVQLRSFSDMGYKGVDDSPYGGGPGMVIRADVLEKALMEGVVKAGNYGEDYRSKIKIILPTPRGKSWNNIEAKQLSLLSDSSDLVFICGRYEGIDERFINEYVDFEFTIGDYILTGGEIPTMALIDSFLRFKKGTLGNYESSFNESFESGLLEYPQYTKPQVFKNVKVPEVLLSGDHKKIHDYRLSESKRITLKYRPDLLGKK